MAAFPPLSPFLTLPAPDPVQQLVLPALAPGRAGIPQTATAGAPCWEGKLKTFYQQTDPTISATVGREVRDQSVRTNQTIHQIPVQLRFTECQCCHRSSIVLLPRTPTPRSRSGSSNRAGTPCHLRQGAHAEDAPCSTVGSFSMIADLCSEMLTSQ